MAQWLQDAESARVADLANGWLVALLAEEVEVDVSREHAEVHETPMPPLSAILNTPQAQVLGVGLGGNSSWNAVELGW